MPGSGKQSLEMQQQIRELLEAGFDPTTIHRRLKVGRSSVYRMKRCLKQHGTAYTPIELNKKNGRPKVLKPEQELAVLEWLRVPENRTRYLDDLVWLIHDRFNIICSTTTMSKLKRKWMAVLDAEEGRGALDEHARQLLRETHPDLAVLQRPAGQHSVVPADESGKATNYEESSIAAALDMQHSHHNTDIHVGDSFEDPQCSDIVVGEQLEEQLRREIDASAVIAAAAAATEALGA